MAGSRPWLVVMRDRIIGEASVDWVFWRWRAAQRGTCARARPNNVILTLLKGCVAGGCERRNDMKVAPNQDYFYSEVVPPSRHLTYERRCDFWSCSDFEVCLLPAGSLSTLNWALSTSAAPVEPIPLEYHRLPRPCEAHRCHYWSKWECK